MRLKRVAHSDYTSARQRQRERERETRRDEVQVFNGTCGHEVEALTEQNTGTYAPSLNGVRD